MSYSNAGAHKFDENREAESFESALSKGIPKQATSEVRNFIQTGQAILATTRFRNTSSFILFFKIFSDKHKKNNYRISILFWGDKAPVRDSLE